MDEYDHRNVSCPTLDGLELAVSFDLHRGWEIEKPVFFHSETRKYMVKLCRVKGFEEAEKKRREDDFRERIGRISKEREAYMEKMLKHKASPEEAEIYKRMAEGRIFDNAGHFPRKIIPFHSL